MSLLAPFGVTPRRRLLGAVGIGVLLLLCAWVASFTWFMHIVGRPAELPAHADGIVAFTGGPERVETALRLLSEGRADRLMLSGIGGGAELSELARRAGLDPAPLAARVTIGRNAATTRGNALETAVWVQAHEIRTLIVVTASYHMPRALAELARTVPGVTLHPVPVTTADRPGRPAVPLRLVAEEYAKFLATSVGITALLPARESLTPGGRTS